MKSMASKYQFKEIEKGRYQYWLKNDFFKAGRNKKKPFTIVIPPPNVTGNLHLGHAWDTTLQDIIIRRKRMQGYDALYLPGMDHAGIATQAKIDEKLKKEGISRHEIGREAFLKVAWQWKDDYSKRILRQWESLGLSLDYSRSRFTLDEQLNKAVNHVFIKLYKNDLIYRGHRIINWDCEAKTALSNIEVEHEETQAKLYYFKYPLVEGNGHITIATTRPETMFADQAIMVHPDDKRYQKFHNKFVYIPNTDVQIPIILDSYVDMSFGTGAVKVTPAHDPNDFQVGLRHHLEMPLCMHEDGKMNHMAFQYENLDRFECRKQLVNDLGKLNLVEKIEDYLTSIGYSERTGVVVEPRLSLQWFINMEPLAKEALAAHVEFIPKRFEKTFVNWMTDTQDWCISRQLWWGHRIPAWYKEDQVLVQVECPGDGWYQDEDVLDTWFSSALWPFSTLGWPDRTKDLDYFYPTNVLVTGYDIIFFWVARMIFQGMHFTKKAPFKEVLIHGLIRDKEGKKMSKSLGNGVDPMDVIEQYGVDALRYFLTTNSAPGQDLRYDETKVESSWNFINKLWNISRFIQMNVDELSVDFTIKTPHDAWLIHRLNQVVLSVDENYEKYEFGEVAKELYHFIWDDFANWYIEFSKIALQDEAIKNNTKAVLSYTLITILKMMHPFIPFVTDAIYQDFTGEKTIMTSPWPTAKTVDLKQIQLFEHVLDMIVKVRNLRSEYQVAPSKNLQIHLVCENKEIYHLLQLETKYLQKFLGCEHVTIEQTLTTKAETVLVVSKETSIYVVKADLIDIEKEVEHLLKQKEHLLNELERSKQMLNNPNFVNRAPKDKVELEKEKLSQYQKQYDIVIGKLKEYVSQ